MMGVEAQWDEPRGSQAFGLASLRIPFDVFSDKSTRQTLTGLDRRMLQPVIRDVDVVTSEYTVPTEILPALNIEGHAIDRAFDIHLEGKTDDEVKAEIEALQAEFADETIAIFLDGNPNNLIDMGSEDNEDWRHILNTGDLSLGANHILSSAGKELMLDYVSSTFGAGSIGYTPDGTPVGINGSITMNPGSHLNAMTVDVTDHIDGVVINQAGTHYITRSTVTNALDGYGVLAEGSGSILHIRDSHIGLNKYGIGATDNAEVYATDNDVFGNKKDQADPFPGNTGRGFDATSGGYIKIVGGTVRDNEGNAINAEGSGGSSTIEIEDTEVFGNTGWATVNANNDGHLILKNVIIRNNDTGNDAGGYLRAGNDGSTATVTGGEIYGNEGSSYAVAVAGNDDANITKITMKDTIIRNNEGHGMQVGGSGANGKLIGINLQIYENSRAGVSTSGSNSSITLYGGRLTDNNHGALAADNAEITLNDVTITGNTPSGNSNYAARVQSGAQITLNGGVVSGNGRGLFSQTDSSSRIFANGVTFGANTGEDFTATDGSIIIDSDSDLHEGYTFSCTSGTIEIAGVTVCP